MNSKTKKTICLLIGIASILTVVSAVSYAYFTASGEVRKMEATISTGTTSARFADNDTGITGELKFGESITKKFTIQNTGTAEARVKMYWKDLVNTYIEGSLTYVLRQSESNEGPYTEVVSKTNVPKTSNVLANSLTIPVGKTYYYELVITLNYLEDVNQDSDLSAKFSSTFSLTDEKGDIDNPSIIDAIIAFSNGTKSSFTAKATINEGVFEMEDDYGISYYYRGAVEDNYVKFGQNKSGQDMFWRIVRINGDGSLRIIYDGTSAHMNGEFSEDRVAMTNAAWNTKYNDNKYIGYMYSPQDKEDGTVVYSTSKEQAQTNETDSNIKTLLDTWYKENIIDTGYSGAVSDEIFCNDRSFANDNKGTGARTSETHYGAYGRLTIDNPQPTFKCEQKNDAFTVEDMTKGNGILDYPVGFITADEIVTAGGKYETTNQNYYLYKGFRYLSFSPMYYSTYSTMFCVSENGSLYKVYSSNKVSIAPVINLSPEYVNTMIGTGTMTDPYRAA